MEQNKMLSMIPQSRWLGSIIV